MWALFGSRILFEMGFYPRKYGIETTDVPYSVLAVPTRAGRRTVLTPPPRTALCTGITSARNGAPHYLNGAKCLNKGVRSVHCFQPCSNRNRNRLTRSISQDCAEICTGIRDLLHCRGGGLKGKVLSSL